MKKLLHKKLFALALTLGAASFAPMALHAQEQVDRHGETEQEHQALVDIIESLAQYGDALKGFTLYFFQEQKGCPQITKSSVAIPPSKAIFLDLAHKLLLQINAINAKIAQYKPLMQTQDSKILIEYLGQLGSLLAETQKKFHSTLQLQLGKPGLYTALMKFRDEGIKNKQKLETLKNKIDRLLAIHQEQKLKQHFDTFIAHIQETQSYPKDMVKALTAIKAYGRLKK